MAKGVILSFISISAGSKPRLGSNFPQMGFVCRVVEK
jgi:hypothetical protein